MPAACTALAPISFLSDAFLYSSCLRIVASRLRLAISAAARLLLELQSRTNRFPRTHAPLNFSSSLSSFVCMSSPLHPQSLAHLGIPTFVTGWARRSCASRNESTRRDPLYYLTLVSRTAFQRLRNLFGIGTKKPPFFSRFVPLSPTLFFTTFSPILRMLP